MVEEVDVNEDVYLLEGFKWGFYIRCVSRIGECRGKKDGGGKWIKCAS